MLRIAIQNASEVRLERWGHTPIARPYWRLYWNADPGWDIVLPRSRVALHPGEVVLVSPETIFHTAWRCPSRHLYLHFTTAGLAGDPLTGVHMLPYTAAFTRLIAMLRHHHFNELDACALACHALARLPDDAFAVREHSPHISRATALAGRFVHRQVTNTELARAAGMQVNSFIRRFRKETGSTPQRWHHQRRIDAACLALESEATAIDELAERFGFCDRHHFTRVFTRLRGIPPAAYRASTDGGRVMASSRIGNDTKAAKTIYGPPGRHEK